MNCNNQKLITKTIDVAIAIAINIHSYSYSYHHSEKLTPKDPSDKNFFLIS